MKAPVDLRVEYLQNPVGLDIEWPRFSWKIESERRGDSVKGYRIIVSSSLANSLGLIGDIWDSLYRECPDNYVDYEGAYLLSATRYFWRVKWWNGRGEGSAFSTPASFVTGMIDGEDWSAEWITAEAPVLFESNGDPVHGKFEESLGIMLRKDFTLDSDRIESAFLFSSYAGYGEIYINGEKIGEDLLDPAPTDYSKRTLYSGYDVTAHLKDKNALGVMLGNGRHIKQYGYDIPRAFVELIVNTKDGNAHRVVSDSSWKWSHGPLRENGLYFGEVYDARLEMPGWSLPGFDDSSWNGAIVSGGPLPKFQLLPTIKCSQELRPVKITSVDPGVYIFDFAQNISGRIRLRAEGPAGTKIVLRHAELLDKNGRLQEGTQRKSESTDIYIMRGGGVESFEPLFTYHGFRYAEVTGFPGVPDETSLVARFIHSSVRETGTLITSNPLIDSLHRNIIYSQKANLMGVPTDCPQRDERQGWMGDAPLVAEEACFNFDMFNFYRKYLNDIMDAQREDGALSDVVPAYWKFYPADPAWGTAYLTFAYTLYRLYGEMRHLAEHYSAMKRYVDFLIGKADNHIQRELGSYGDWCPPGSILPKKTPIELTSTWHYYHDVLRLSQIAEALAIHEDAKKYGRCASEIKEAFNGEFLKEYGYATNPVSKKGHYGIGQTSNALPLFLDMVPAQKKKFILDRLIEDIVENQDKHLDTGIIGTRYLFDVLSSNGYEELAFEVATQESYPGWGYMLSNGATTLWERWERLEGSGMNSHNHIMLGSIDSWFYRYVAGLKPGEPGWKTFEAAPPNISSLDYAGASVESPYGKLSFSWLKTDGDIETTCKVPVGVRGRISLPRLSAESKLYEGDRLLASDSVVGNIEGIEGIWIKQDKFIMDVSSGLFTLKVSHT